MMEGAATRNGARLSKTGVSDNLELTGREMLSNTSMITLDSKCILQIFIRMDLEDLCRVSEASKQFKQVAEQAFSQRYEIIDFERPKSYNKSLFRRVLCKFGALVKSIDTTEIYPHDEMILNNIARYCTGTLEKLFVSHITIDCNKVRPLFSHLKLLQLNCCKFEGDNRLLLSNCPELEHLYVDSVTDSSFLERKFPKLDILEFGEFVWVSLWRLLELNPQIKTLNVMGYPDDYMVSNIVHLLKNVERLIIKPGMMCKTARLQSTQVLLQLSKLKSLKDLSLNAGGETYSKSVTKLMNAFTKAKVALEELDLSRFSITAKDIKSMANVNTLQTLRLGAIKVNCIDHLIPLAQQLPLLSELQFGFEGDAKISVNDIQNFIQLAAQLKCLGIFNIRNLKIKQHDYDSILAIVRDREKEEKVIIFLSGCKNTTNCDILQEDRKWLHIDFESSECECEKCCEADSDD